MPLVLMCGCPSSGKTKRAKELVSYLSENRPNVKTVLVDDLNLHRNLVYADSKKEVTTRGALKSWVERELTTDTIVIVDSLNYIKGYRYELNCVSKYVRTTYCVVHCAASKENMHKFNQLKNMEEQYSDEILEALWMRFETPNSMARWDSPLFTVQVDDDMPCEKICNAIFNAKAPKPNMSTQNPPLMSPTFVHEADKMLQSIGASILSAQKTANLGDTITLPGCNEVFTINHIISIPDMRRHRKQFLTYLRANPVANIKDVPRTFLSFLTTAVA